MSAVAAHRGPSSMLQWRACNRNNTTGLLAADLTLTLVIWTEMLPVTVVLMGMTVKGQVRIQGRETAVSVLTGKVYVKVVQVL